MVEALRRGESPGVLIQELAEFRDDKANPRDYAERTVVRACRSLGVRNRRRITVGGIRSRWAPPGASGRAMWRDRCHEAEEVAAARRGGDRR